jgi:hypothetical protein
MGYAIVSREDNESCMHCSELTLVRIQHIWWGSLDEIAAGMSIVYL